MRYRLFVSALVAVISVIGLVYIVSAQAERHRPTPIPHGSIEAQIPYIIAACGSQIGPTITLDSSPVIWGPARLATFQTCAIIEAHGILYSLPHFGPTSIQS